ncbi:MAG: lamin tail domain-containing protein, partial [candidate division KSB1 bacterium]|nr:lamin tail domain-containing protein [candidate division KSB1 bacterium]
RSLLKSGEYTEYFLGRFADLMNTTLHYDHIIEVIDSLAAVIEPDYALEAERWGVTKESWSNNISSLKSYVVKRHNYMFKHLRAYFNTGTVNQLMIDPDPSNGGSVKVNTIHPRVYPWTGMYFNGLPLELVATPEPGYRFVAWRGDVESAEDSITLYLKSDMKVTPFFEVDSSYINVMIHEINYNSSNEVDTEDWVELHNHSNRDVDLGGWIFCDSVDSNRYLFSPNTMIKKSGYLILARDTTAFRKYFPNAGLICGNMDFGFNAGGELLRLYDQDGILVDSVHYDDNLPWPVEADGNGPTLELISPVLDNSLAASWQARDHYGSPGLPNHSTLDPVPVTLTYFRMAEITAEYVTLQWRTESETNNWGFFIERRETGGDFTPVQFIKGKGSTVIPSVYSYTDREIMSEITFYRLKQIDFDGTFEYSEEIQVFRDIPEMPVLHGCYPNPFNNRMMISFTTPVSMVSDVSLYNVRGELIRTIQNGMMSAGHHRIEWDGRDRMGDIVPSGVFLVGVTLGRYKMVRKVICLK